MLCAPLDWKYEELPSSASDAVLCSFVRCGTSKTNRKKIPKFAYLIRISMFNKRTNPIKRTRMMEMEVRLFKKVH